MGKIAPPSVAKFTKAELTSTFLTTKNSKERNKCMKALDKFERITDEQYDNMATKQNLEARHFKNFQVYICDRCFKPNYNVQKGWLKLKDAPKVVCMACYRVLKEKSELGSMLKTNQNKGLVPRTFGLDFSSRHPTSR